MRLLGLYCNRGRDTDGVRRLVDDARSSVGGRLPRARVLSPTSTKQLTKAQNDSIVAAYLAGRPVVSIAIDYGVTSWTIWYRIKQAGVVRRSHRITAHEIDEALALRARGLSVNKIADRLGCARLSVTRELKRRSAF